MDLSELTYDVFKGRAGETFHDIEAGIAFELVAVDDLTEVARNVPQDARAPFSLVFRAPAEPVLPQSIRPLRHDELGDLAVFLVPVGLEPDGLRYQAVFS